MRTHLNLRHHNFARVIAFAVAGSLALTSCASGSESGGAGLDQQVKVVTEKLAVDGDRNAALPGADDGRPFNGANCCVNDITDVDLINSVTTGRESSVGILTGGVAVIDNRFLVDRSQPRIDSAVQDVLPDGEGGYFAAASGRFRVGTSTRMAVAHVTQANTVSNDLNFPSLAGQIPIQANSVARVGTSTFVATYSNLYRVTNDAIETVDIAGTNKRVSSFGEYLVVTTNTGGFQKTLTILDEQLRRIDTVTFWHEVSTPSISTFVEGENLYVAGRFDGFNESRCGLSSNSSLNFRMFTLRDGCLTPTSHTIAFEGADFVSALTAYRGGIVLAVKSGIDTKFKLYVVTEAEARPMPDTNMPTVVGEVTNMIEFGLNLVYSLKYTGLLRLTGGANGNQAINTYSSLWHLSPTPAGSTPTYFEGRLGARTTNQVFDLAVSGTKLLVAHSGESAIGSNLRGASWYVDSTGTYKKLGTAGLGDYVEAINGGRNLAVASYGSVKIVDTSLGTIIADFPVTRNGRSDFISDLAVAGNNVYVVGMFDTIGGQARNGLAQINVAAAPVIGPLGANRTFYAGLGRQIYPAKVEASDESPHIFLAASRTGITPSVDGKPQSFLAIEIATGKVSNWVPRNDSFAELLDMTISGNQLLVAYSSDIVVSPAIWQSVYLYRVGEEPVPIFLRNGLNEPKDAFKSIAIFASIIVAVNALNERDVLVYNGITRTTRRLDFGGAVTRVKKSTDGVWVLGRFTSAGQSRAEAPVKIDISANVRLSDNSLTNQFQLADDTGNLATVQSRVISVGEWAAAPGDGAPNDSGVNPGGDAGGGASDPVGGGADDPVVGINLPDDTQVVDSPVGPQVVNVDNNGVVRPADSATSDQIGNAIGVSLGTSGGGSPTVVASAESRRVVISSITPGNRSLTVSWSSGTAGESHVARTSNGSRVFSCASTTNSCVINGLSPIEVYSVTVAPEVDSSAASTPSVYVKPIVTAKKGASVKASSIISIKSSAKKSWKVRGGCTLSGTSVKMPKKPARCTVTLSVAASKAKPRATYSATVVVG
ncbi:MAG: hypothetical protein FJW98_02275 [Actinobacteria bacterium]|nr:hypothetical protein [Actinomycetota bacterium]